MLNAHGLACTRGDRNLFAGLDLAVGAGQCLHVCGANGAGKSSLLRILAGLSQPLEGEIRWNGQPIGEVTDEFHRDLLFLGHQDAVKQDLSGLENLQFAAALDGMPLTEDAAVAALRRFGLQGREDLPARCLSAGQKKRVALARLLTGKAALWILDEPFSALDIGAVDELANLIGHHLVDGGMAVLTSHQAIPVSDIRYLQL